MTKSNTPVHNSIEHVNKIESSNVEVPNFEHRLTTIDNPFDPFDSFDEWNAFDEQLSYYSCSLLARVSSYSDELSETDKTITTEQAIDDIVRNDPFLMYRKVSKEVSSVP